MRIFCMNFWDVGWILVPMLLWATPVSVILTYWKYIVMPDLMCVKVNKQGLGKNILEWTTLT